jgi:hypothetical protein
MDLPLWLHPSAAGLSLAAAAVAMGAPIFSGGLRALRLRRIFASLREVSLADSPSGLVHVRGAVGLESPLFSPLSGVPCAGFRLEVRGLETPLARALDVFRPFRLAAGGISARVRPGDARWVLSETGSRTFAPRQPLTQNLEGLLARVPEARWLRRAGATVRLTERALVEGGECHVVGYVRGGRGVELLDEAELARTGTDDAPPARAVGAAVAPDADLHIDSGDHLRFLLVSDRPPQPAHLSIAALPLAGVVLGPLLSLAGMLYFANAADYLRALGER